jgi:predicted PurR-regulated permease PerM
MIAVGTMTGLACWLLGLPSPLLLGLIAGLAELIPMVGPAIGAIPALAVAATLRPGCCHCSSSPTWSSTSSRATLVPIACNNAGISPFLIIASLLLGGALDGLRGALLAVPIAASIEVILESLQDREMPVAPTTEGATAAQPGSVTDPQAPAQAL